MNAEASPVGKVSVISTGTVDIRPQHVRSDGTPPLWWLMTSRRWTGPRPTNAFVIERADGLVLFDLGQDRASVTDGDYLPKGVAGVLNRRLARFDIGPDQTLAARLANLGYDIADVHTAVLSHLHVDHIGGLPELTHATIVTSHAERQTVDRPLARINGLMREHILLPGLRWQLVTPQQIEDRLLAPFTAAHDLFGDGSLVLLPTPGHTPGSVSLLVRRPGFRAAADGGRPELRRGPDGGRARAGHRAAPSAARQHAQGQRAAREVPGPGGAGGSRSWRGGQPGSRGAADQLSLDSQLQHA